MSQMIGTLMIRQGPRDVTVQLDDALRWHSNDQGLERYLNSVFPIESDYRDKPEWLVRALYQAGERLGADVRVGPALAV
jgi:hypothetical protein